MNRENLISGHERVYGRARKRNLVPRGSPPQSSRTPCDFLLLRVAESPDCVPRLQQAQVCSQASQTETENFGVISGGACLGDLSCTQIAADRCSSEQRPSTGVALLFLLQFCRAGSPEAVAHPRDRGDSTRKFQVIHH